MIRAKMFERGRALSGTQLNATADIAGSFVYTPALGTRLHAGNSQTLRVVFTPTDTANYNMAAKDIGGLQVSRLRSG